MISDGCVLKLRIEGKLTTLRRGPYCIRCQFSLDAPEPYQLRITCRTDSRYSAFHGVAAVVDDALRLDLAAIRAGFRRFLHEKCVVAVIAGEICHFKILLDPLPLRHVIPIILLGGKQLVLPIDEPAVSKRRIETTHIKRLL